MQFIVPIASNANWVALLSGHFGDMSNSTQLLQRVDVSPAAMVQMKASICEFGIVQLRAARCGAGVSWALAGWHVGGLVERRMRSQRSAAVAPVWRVGVERDEC